MPRPAQRRRASPPPSKTMLTPPPPPKTPATPATDLAARIGDFSMASPVVAGDSFSAQNRAILLAGLTPASPASSASASSPPPPPTHPGSPKKQKQKHPQQQQQHHQQLPLSPSPPPPTHYHPRPRPRPPQATPLHHPRLTPLVTPKHGTSTGGIASPRSTPTPRQQLLPPQWPHHHHHHLAAPSPRALSPCVYVKATAMRAPAAATPPNSGAGATPPPESGRLLVTARVRPVAAGREPFEIERAFVRAQLRDAVRGDRGGSPGTVSIVPSPLRTRAPGMWPGSGSSSGLSPGIKRPAPEDDSDSDSDNDNDDTPRPGPSQLVAASPDRFHHDGGIPIPYVPHVALGTLPALAAVVLSGYVKPNDVVELPVPHPAAWPQTVAYVYAGDGPLSEAMRRNIAHLGGEV